MVDFLRCWLRTAHEQHGWTEVYDGREAVVHEGASTVLQVPDGGWVRYHHCDGVPELRDENKGLKEILPERRDYEHWYVVQEQDRHSGRIQLDGNQVTHRVERRVTLEAIYERTVIETPWVQVQRITCFCCSCGDRPGSDPACRNHGFAGLRPCEEHGTPGSVWDEDFENGPRGMPDSVQVVRRVRKELEATDNGG